MGRGQDLPNLKEGTMDKVKVIEVMHEGRHISTIEGDWCSLRVYKKPVLPVKDSPHATQRTDGG